MIPHDRPARRGNLRLKILTLSLAALSAAWLGLSIGGAVLVPPAVHAGPGELAETVRAVRAHDARVAAARVRRAPLDAATVAYRFTAAYLRRTAEAREVLRRPIGIVLSSTPHAKSGTWEEHRFRVGDLDFRVVGGKAPAPAKVAYLSTMASGRRWLWTAGERFEVLGDDGLGVLVVRPDGAGHLAPAFSEADPTHGLASPIAPRAPPASRAPLIVGAVGHADANPLPVHGRIWIDARDYGLGVANTDNAAALQAAVDAAKAANTPLLATNGAPTATVFIPAAKGAYNFASPVWVDGSFVEIRGEQGGTQLVMTGGFPLFIVGFNRAGVTRPDINYRPDIFGKLDASAASATGQRWGLRTKYQYVPDPIGHPGVIAPDLRLTSPASHFSHGVGRDKYSATSKFTVEFAIEGAAGGQVVNPGSSNGWLMGVGELDPGGHAVPNYTWQVVVTGTNQFRFIFSTQAQRLGPTTGHLYQLSTGALTGVQKIALQVDGSSGAVTAVVNGLQASLSQLDHPVAAGSTLTENQYDAFVLNNEGSKIYTGALSDFSLYGLALSRSVRYTQPGNGLTVARVDGKAITDQTRYFPPPGDDANLIGYLGFTENPATMPRHLAITGGDGQLSSAFLYNTDTIENAATGVRFTDIELIGGRDFGSAIAMARTLDCRFDGVLASGGAYAISSIPVGANYTHKFTNCQLSAWDAPLMTYDMIARLDHVDIVNPGLAAFRLVGSDTMIRDTTVTRLGSPQFAFAMIHQGGYGGFTSFERVIVDNEGQPNLLCGIYAERDPGIQSVLRVKDVDFAELGDVPAIKLVQVATPDSGLRAILDVDYAHGQFGGASVEVDGGGWGGTVARMAGIRASHVSNVGSTPGAVVVEDTAFVSPPPFGAWYPNASRFTVPGAADGQYREWGVLAAGVMGSSAPPLFIGRRPEQSSPNALAAYATDHTAISATLSGQASSWGQPTDFAVCAMAQAMFSQTPPGVPANYKVGLSTANATRTGIFPGGLAPVEPDPSTGYTAATKANSSATFTAASAGSKASATPITFGTATAPYTVKSIFLADAASGQVWATIQLASPLVVGIGVTPTINSGALAFAHTPLSGPQGCLTDFGWAKVYDYAFRGTTFTAPTAFFACLTTAPTSKATTSLSEPGNGYLRVSVSNDAAHWSTILTTNPPALQEYGTATNILPIAFPTATGSQGPITGTALADASSGGNVWAVAPVTAPAAFTTGAAPSFAPGAFVAGVN